MTIDKPENSDQTKVCAKTKWSVRPHWRYDSSGNTICGRCYARAKWNEKFIPIGVACDVCKSIQTTKTKYGIPRWAKNPDREGGYLCWSCYITKINTGRILSPDGRKNLSNGIRRALDEGAVMGPKVHTIDETVFEIITEPSAYWVGNLMADGNIYTGKTGNPRISLTVAERDWQHLFNFRNFLNCSNQISLKTSKLNGKAWIQYTLRFISKRIADRLIELGVTPRKSLTAKVIGLGNNRHFWRGVLDGDGYIKNKDGIDGDRVVVVGSYDLMRQFEDFIRSSIPGAIVRVKQDKRINRLYIYSYTARALVEMLYYDCHIALERKLAKALRIFSYIL